MGTPVPPEITWKLGLGLGYGSQAEREFSWYLKGPLKACEMALTLKTHTADAAMLFLGMRKSKKRMVRKSCRNYCFPEDARSLPRGSIFQRISRSQPPTPCLPG